MKPSLLPLLALLMALLAGLSRADDSGLTASIVIPHEDDQPGVLAWSAVERGAHFHVLLTNTSNQTERIFQEWCSWGYFALTFEITDESGQTSIASKLTHAWTRNGPAYWTIGPRESFVVDVHFADRKTWGDGFWLGPGHPTGKITLKAIYRVAADEHSARLGVWTGQIASKPVGCLIK